MTMVHELLAWLRFHPVLNCSLLDVPSDIQTQHSGHASTTDRTRLLMHYHDEKCHVATGDAMYHHSHSMTVQLAAQSNPLQPQTACAGLTCCYKQGE